MKQFVKMKDISGEAIHTRLVVEQFRDTLSADNEYLIDMEGVERISRSAADELYNLTHSNIKVDIINLSPFVAKMLDVVTKGRFMPRVRTHSKIEIVFCNDMQTLSRELLAFSNISTN